MGCASSVAAKAPIDEDDQHAAQLGKQSLTPSACSVTGTRKCGKTGAKGKNGKGSRSSDDGAEKGGKGRSSDDGGWNMTTSSGAGAKEQQGNSLRGSSSGMFKVLRVDAPQPDSDGGAGGNGMRRSGVKRISVNGAIHGAQSFEEVTSDSAVKVMVVVRPMLEFEKQKGSTDIVTLIGPTKLKLPNKAGGAGGDQGPMFDFDRVYRADSLAVNQRLFAEMVKPLVDRFCQGFNCTVLAYGQTGSGKTFTMGTAAGRPEVLAREPKGLIPQLMSVVFNYIKQASKTYDVAIKVSYVEIYNEAINDLLIKSQPALPNSKVCPAPVKLEIRESPEGEIYVGGATLVAADDREALARMLEAGNAARSVASHKMNEQSSRSHAILTVHMDQRARPCAYKHVPTELRYLKSKLHLVDLAGSERAKETGATGERFSEGISINKGLLELGNVINALTEGDGKRHVPYRNSKLTRVLQDSLGGNSETLFIACLSPADSNLDHSINTLRYASRARNIKNNLRLNNGLSAEEELDYLRGLVQRLTAENQELKAKYEPDTPPPQR